MGQQDFIFCICKAAQHLSVSEQGPETQKANITHPCLGFGLTPWQRSEHNTQNPQSWAGMTQPLPVNKVEQKPTTHFKR